MEYTYKDTPVGFHRLNKMPLDDKEIFLSTSDLFEYIKSGTAYHGQRILLKYDNYDQEIILKKSKGDKLIPIMILPNGYEAIIKDFSNYKYMLISYFNNGTLYNNKEKDSIRFIDSFAWCMLPQANLIANSDDTITYMLEVDDDQRVIFTSKNFALESVPLNISDSINGVSSLSSTRGFFITNDPFICLLPIVENNHIIKLWVRCDDYYNAMGV